MKPFNSFYLAAAVALIIVISAPWYAAAFTTQQLSLFHLNPSSALSTRNLELAFTSPLHRYHSHRPFYNIEKKNNHRTKTK